MVEEKRPELIGKESRGEDGGRTSPSQYPPPVLEEFGHSAHSDCTPTILVCSMTASIPVCIIYKEVIVQEALVYYSYVY